MITIKNRFTIEVMFTSSDESQSLRDFILELIEKGANLSGANLYGAYLSGAYLSGANLYRADLSGAYLSGADLSRANLYGADLSRADLSRANLSGANLYGANLSGANLSGANLSGADLSRADLSRADLYGANLYGATMPIFCKWNTHGIVDGKVRIGCETRSIKDWDSFFASDEVITTPRNTDEFKQIRAVYESYKAYLTHLK